MYLVYPQRCTHCTPKMYPTHPKDVPNAPPRCTQCIIKMYPMYPQKKPYNPPKKTLQPDMQNAIRITKSYCGCRVFWGIVGFFWGTLGTTHGCNWYNSWVQLVQHRGCNWYNIGVQRGTTWVQPSGTTLNIYWVHHMM